METFLTSGEVADALLISKTTVHNMLNNPETYSIELPRPMKAGRINLWKLSEIMEFKKVLDTTPNRIRRTGGERGRSAHKKTMKDNGLIFPCI